MLCISPNFKAILKTEKATGINGNKTTSEKSGNWFEYLLSH